MNCFVSFAPSMTPIHQPPRGAAQDVAAAFGNHRLPISVRTPHATITNAGAVTSPERWISAVATSGDVPLKIVNATLKHRATPLKRTRVGNKSVSRTANVPLTNPAASPARTSSRIGLPAWAASAP